MSWQEAVVASVRALVNGWVVVTAIGAVATLWLGRKVGR